MRGVLCHGTQEPFARRVIRSASPAVDYVFLTGSSKSVDSPKAVFPRTQPSIVLASRSPRRLELLRLLVPSESIRVCPPRNSVEAGFAELHDLPAIEARLLEIARAKGACVREQLAVANDGAGGPQVIVSADTEIVVSDLAGRPHVLGQPPDDETWREVVRHWFRHDYAGRTHLAMTGLCILVGGRAIERLVRTEVTFRADVDAHLDWYLSTGEPRGKAGGYAIQGAGSLFVTQVKGSLSNVVGLPLEALREVFEGLGI